VRDLQRRLGALGLDTSADEAGRFGPATAAAVRELQARRGLPASGACDAVTWEALVEAGWRVGDRPLYLAQPMLRGDDVADLQRRLSALGFDVGRVDGIFGPLTDRALADFQRNAGLVCDAVCGPGTIAALLRLGDRPAAAVPLSVGAVRERERLRQGPRSLAGRSVALGHGGGLDALASASVGALLDAGAQAVVVQDPDGSVQAARANSLAVDVFIGLAMADDATTCRVAYYRDPGGWESPGGRLLAELLADVTAPMLDGKPGGATGMSMPLLRETRMPAVIAELAPPAAVVERTAALAAAIPAVLDRWIRRFHEDDALDC
jgi:N-acetylmuramoyl-L-alanine amidase